jgi:O-antigen ligase
MARALRETPWPVLLLVASFLCPTELSVYVGSARLPPHRALLLVLLPYALFALFGRSRVKPRMFDVAFLGFAVWTVIVYVYHHGQADGLQSGGALALDAVGSFLVARAFVRDERAFTGTAMALLVAVAIAGLTALPETLFGQVFIHDFLRNVTGYVHPVGIEKRLGLTRAFGLFDHPIHLGTFCAGNLALAVYATRRNVDAGMRAFVISASALTSLSSAPMLSLAVQTLLIGYERGTRGIKGRGAVAIAVIVAVFAVISVIATRSPFAIIATGFTLDSWTGYYRLMIWEHGLENVWSNPWMGIGLNDWVRPMWMASPTIDAFWLVIAMKGGIPSFLLLASCILLIGRGVVVRMRRSEPDRHALATGWMISLITLSLVGCTVHYWNVPFAYFFFFVGLGGCLADPLRKASAVPAAAAVTKPVRRVEWIAPGMVPAHGAGLSAPRWPVPVVAGSLRQPRR